MSTGGISVTREYQRRAAAERHRTPKNTGKVGLLGPFVIGLIVTALVLAGIGYVLHEVLGPIADMLDQMKEGQR